MLPLSLENASSVACLTLGRPQFKDPSIAAIARESGDAAAWQAALANGPVEAAAGASGDFAVALRDASGRTFLAVDRFAVRTLCYRLVDGELRFAPRADDLAGRDGALAPQAIFDYLYFHAIPSPRTVFDHVSRLPPGHYALYEHGRLTVAPYWVPHFEPTRTPSFEALRDEFRALLRRAVARQLGSGKPACFLSGGTDSSTVAGLIGEVTGQPAATYSIGFEAQGYDEMAYARIAARRFGTRHHEYYVTPDDLVRTIESVAQHYDQPFGNSSAVPAYHCALLAREDGVDTLLAGDGGDELFGGNARYAKQRVFGWYAEVVPAGLRAHLLERLGAVDGLRRVPLWRKCVSYIEQARVPMPDRMQMYNLLMRLGVDAVLEPRFRERVDIDDPARQQRMVWRQPHAPVEIDRTLAYDWRYTLAENDLRKVVGTTEMAGIGVGFPLLDQELLDFSMRLPAHYKLRGLRLRWFFKEALRGFLPDEIIAKKKHGFGLPFGVWVCQHPGLKALAADALGSLKSRGIVRADFIGRLWDDYLPSHPGYYGEMVWILMMLELWMRRHAPGWACRA